MNIAETINKTTKIFNINTSKISHCVTENASNFGKTFRIFSTKNETKSISLDSISDDEDDGEPIETNFEIEVVDTNSNVDVTEMSSIFVNSNESFPVELEDDLIYLFC